MKPNLKPKNPNFSSGPCSKNPEFKLEQLKGTPFGRSHRSKYCKERINNAMEQTRKLLKIPANYLIGIVPASDTGAIEMAMWNLLGPRGVDVVYFESFGKAWAADIKKQLKLENVNVIDSDYGKLPDLSKVNFDNDVVFTWNGTTSGVKLPDGDWIVDDRKGLTITDATSAVFAMEIPWEKIDVATYSWQKALGGEAAHGILILSPRAVERIESYIPAWPMPKVFQLRKGEKLNKTIFEGSPINTISMLCLEDYIVALNWVETIGGLDIMIERSMDNLAKVDEFVQKHNWIEFLAESKEITSNTSVCLKLDVTPDQIKQIASILEKEDVAYDCKSYREAPLGLRFWCGATIETDDVAIMLEWLKWAYNEVKV